MSATCEIVTPKPMDRLKLPEGDGARSVEVRLPASAANLGSGFDCCGLALQLYLSVRATELPVGANSEVLVHTENIRRAGVGGISDNLIYRTMRLVADREGLDLPPVRLEMLPEIPFASG